MIEIVNPVLFFCDFRVMVHARIYSPTVRIGHIILRISKIRSVFTSTPKN